MYTKLASALLRYCGTAAPEDVAGDDTCVANALLGRVVATDSTQDDGSWSVFDLCKLAKFTARQPTRTQPTTAVRHALVSVTPL